MFSSSLSAGKRAGECRTIFENKILNCFEIIEVEERACALSKVVVRVSFTTDIVSFYLYDYLPHRRDHSIDHAVQQGYRSS